MIRMDTLKLDVWEVLKFGMDAGRKGGDERRKAKKKACQVKGAEGEEGAREQ